LGGTSAKIALVQETGESSSVTTIPALGNGDSAAIVVESLKLRICARGKPILIRIILCGAALLACALPGLAADGAWKQLFNGKDLTGWEHAGEGSMTVENGLIRTNGGGGLLWWTGGKIGRSVIRVVYKTQHRVDNSGVFIRIPIKPRESWMPVHYGYEVQIENEPERYKEGDYHYTGCLYSLTKALAKPGRPGPEWNTLEITIDGPRTIVYVNRVKVTDYKEGDPVPPRKENYEPVRGPRPDEGYIGLQNEGKDDVVFFKEVSVKALR
jgi:hypothetical protein